MHFNDADLAANEAFAAIDFFRATGEDGYRFLHSAYSGRTDGVHQMAALYIIFRAFPERKRLYLESPGPTPFGYDAGYCYPHLKPYIARLDTFTVVKALPTLADYAARAPKDLAEFIAVVGPVLLAGDAAQVELAIGVADRNPAIAFASGDWPKGVVAAMLAKPALAPKLEEHLQRNAGVIAPDIKALIVASLNGRDIFDVLGIAMAKNAAAGLAGLDAARKMLDAAAAKDKADNRVADAPGVVSVLDAIARRGGVTLLDAASGFLTDERPPVAQTAFKVFQIHAANLGAKLGSNQECFVWWTVQGKQLVQLK